MKKILITMLSASLILTGCSTKNSSVEDSVANQTKRIEHNLEEAAKNINYKIYARGNESSLAKPATLNLITADKANKDIKLSNGFVVDLKDVVDVFNEYLPNTYSEEEVLEILRKDENFKETNDKFDSNNTKDDIVKYYKQDKKLVINFQGTSGNRFEAEPKDNWKIEGDKVKINIVDPMEKERNFKYKVGEITLSLNNKNYKGGKERSYYYVDSVSYSDESNTNDSKSSKEETKTQNTSANHNYEAAAGLADAVIIVGYGAGDLGHPFYLQTVTEQRRKKISDKHNIYSISAADYLDVVNALKERTYTMNEALDLLKVTSTYKEYNEKSTSFSPKATSEGYIYYFKGDNTIVINGGGNGGVIGNKVSDKSSWKVDGDRITIPILGGTPANDGKGVVGSVTVRLNNKQYSGGNRKSIYYVEKIERGENF